MKKHLLTLAIVCLTIGSMNMFALDGKVYPGSMGVRWNSSDPVPALGWSAIFNPSTTKSLRVDLPVIHDVIAKTIRQGWVRVVDKHYTQGVRAQLCAVYKGCSTGFYGKCLANKYSSGTSECPKVLSFGAVGAGSTAHYYFSCTIPPVYSGQKSGIVSYFVEEYE